MKIIEIEARAVQLRNWLSDNAPGVFTEQKHCDEGSQEQSYWHHGYMMACLDIARALRKDPIEPNGELFN